VPFQLRAIPAIEKWRNMQRELKSSISLALSLALLSLTPLSAIAQHPDNQPLQHDLPLVRIQTFARGDLSFSQLINGHYLNQQKFGSIGELSGFGSLRLDDRNINQSGLLSQNSRIQTGAASNAQADLGQWGRLVMMANSDLAVSAGDHILYAKLIDGSVKLELPAGVTGVVEAANTILVNPSGTASAFTVQVDGDRVLVNGQDAQTPQTQSNVAEEFEIAFLTRREERMKPNQSLELQVKVTDKQRRPRAGMVVNFSSQDLLGNTTGQLNPASAVTDANGIARTNFVSSAGNSRAVVTASLPGTALTATMMINVQGGVILGFNTVQLVTLAGVAGAAAFGVTQAANNNGNNAPPTQPGAVSTIEVIGSGD
jgi:hypothetical protein